MPFAPSPLLITILMGGIPAIKNGWFMTLLYPHYAIENDMMISMFAVWLHETMHRFGKKDMGRQVLDYRKVFEGVKPRFNPKCPNIYKPIHVIPTPCYQTSPKNLDLVVELDIFGNIEYGVSNIRGMGWDCSSGRCAPGQVDLDMCHIPTNHRPQDSLISGVYMHPYEIQCGAPKIAKLVYNSNN